MDVDSDEPQTSQPIVRSPTEHIRNKIRQYTQKHREDRRVKTTDTIRFGLGEVQEEVEELDKITEQDINALITRITRRKHASEEEMHKLSEAFLQSMDIIKLFFRAQGALKIIAKDISAIDVGRQIGALECLCNLSLGDATICERIFYYAGNNLMSCLNSPDERLKRTSLWIITNIIYTSRKAANALVQMDIIKTLFLIYVDVAGDADIANEYREDAAVCLQILVRGPNRAARYEDVMYIKDNMLKKCRTTVAAEYMLKILFHADIVNPNNEFNIEQTYYIMDFVLSNLYSTPDFGNIANRLRIIYAIRILSNMVQCAPKSLHALDGLARNVWKTRLEDLLNKVFYFDEDLLSLEVIYLIRNLVDNQSSHMLPCQLDRLNIPNIDYEKLLPKD